MNTISIRKYNKETDLQIIQSWCEFHKFPILHDGVIPETSFLVEVDGIPRLFHSLYMLNCKDIVMWENLISHPENTKEQRRMYITTLFAYEVGYCQALGYKVMIGFCDPKLADRYLELGAVIGEKDRVSVVYNL